MLSLTAQPRSLCDGIPRREVLRLGALATVGLSLPQVLQAEGKTRAARSCLLIFMEGGPSHIDLWDMKPAAPAEIRGEFKPIVTDVPGLQVCEHLPLLSRQMHRLALVRSVTHSIVDHNAGSYYTLTGRYPVDGGKLIVADGPTNFPPYGAVLSHLRPTGRPLPDFVHIPEFMSNNGVDIAGESAGFLGARHDPLVAGDPSLPGYQVPGMEPIGEVSLARLNERRSVLGALDQELGQLGDDAAVARLDTFRRKAYELLASPEARCAFDLSREPLTLRERYGMDRGSDRSIEARQFGGLPHLGQCLLLARRLIEAGIRLVTVVTGRRIDQAWDTHRQHFPLLKRSLLPFFDRALSTLLEDMAERGLLEETLVAILGEFGRTPRLGYVTSGAGAAPNGRDHWPYCYTVLFAGAGIPGGAILGASDKHAAYPSRDPVKPEDIAATIYGAMGVPPHQEIRDPQHRPHPLILGTPIRGLLS